jgi:hypothetical protein
MYNCGTKIVEHLVLVYKHMVLKIWEELKRPRRKPPFLCWFFMNASDGLRVLKYPKPALIFDSDSLITHTGGY